MPFLNHLNSVWRHLGFDFENGFRFHPDSDTCPKYKAFELLHEKFQSKTQALFQAINFSIESGPRLTVKDYRATLDNGVYRCFAERYDPDREDSARKFFLVTTIKLANHTVHCVGIAETGSILHSMEFSSCNLNTDS